MLNKIFKYGLNSRGAVEYVIDQELHKGMATIMRGGDPNITKLLISSNQRKWKYTSGVLSFTESNLSEDKKNKIMQLFEETFLSGLDCDQYNILWVQHLDKNRLELHWIVPRIELSTGKSLSIYSNEKDYKKRDLFQTYINAKYKLKAPMKKSLYITIKDRENEGNMLNIRRSDAKALKKALDRETAFHVQENIRQYSIGKFYSAENQEKIKLKSLKIGKRNDRLRKKIDEYNRRKIEGTKRSINRPSFGNQIRTETTERAKRLDTKVVAIAYRKRRRRRSNNRAIQKIGGDIQEFLSRLFNTLGHKTLSCYQHLTDMEEQRLLKEKRERETVEEMKNFHPYDIDSQSVLSWLENQDFGEDHPCIDNAPIHTDDDLDISTNSDRSDENIQPDQKKTKKKKKRLRKL